MISYPIIFEQPKLWKPKSIVAVKLAVMVVDAALSPYTGLAQGESFPAVFGTIKMRFTSTLTTYGLAIWGVIRFRNNAVISLPGAVHEYGHLFSVILDNDPIDQHIADKIATLRASDWPGMHPPSVAEYNTTEMFVNDWERWAMQLTKRDKSGLALGKWFDKYMPVWVEKAIKKNRPDPPEVYVAGTQFVKWD